MEQNRYSRQLIVLRAVISGYSGHARLVQSGSDAELELRLQSPSGSAELWATLVEKSMDGYRSCPLGQLTVDDRGQATGSFAMTAADISPEILAIVQRDDDDCKLAMSGFLNGPRNVNWADVRAAACDAVTANRCTVTPPATSQLPEIDDNDRDDDDDDHDRDGSCEPEDDDDARPGATAAEVAGISPDAIWPDEIAALQPFFETQSPVPAFLGTRYTFVHMPASADQPEYLAGLWCLYGDPTRAAYAVPADTPDAQPPELEGFLWRANADGSGFWVAYIDATTGEPISNDY